MGLCDAVTSIPAQAPNSVTAQYISSVPAMPMKNTLAPASQIPRAAASANAGLVSRASNPITTDFDYVTLNTTEGLTNPTGTGPENTFIITPHTENTFGGSFNLTITATDGVNTKTATTTLTLPV